MKCPYGNHEHGAKVFEGDKFSRCLVCGKSAMVETHASITGYMFTLSRTGRRKTAEPKRVRTVRLSDRDMEAVAQGRLRLTVIGNRITVTV
jgi:hypothetical protein